MMKVYDDKGMFLREIYYLSELSEGETIDPEDHKNHLIEKAALLAAEKYEAIPGLILGPKTPLVDIYKRQYEKALNGDYDVTKNALIIAKRNEYYVIYDNLMDRIKAAYDQILLLIEAGELAKAENIIGEMEKFGIDASDAQINALLENM